MKIMYKHLGLALRKRSASKGFTLIELLIVIVILGVLAALISGNFMTSLQKGRDARRKADLEQVQRALEIYYGDNKRYPDTISFGNSFCQTNSPCAGEVYMQRTPNDPKPEKHYNYQTDANGTYFKLYACLENTQDNGAGTKQAGYDPSDCGTCGTKGLCTYGISSANTTP